MLEGGARGTTQLHHCQTASATAPSRTVSYRLCNILELRQTRGCSNIFIDLRFTRSAFFHRRKPNIFDNMLAIMEKYASNLETQVAERTHLLMEEKKKTDALLYSMLPRYVRTYALSGRCTISQNLLSANNVMNHEYVYCVYLTCGLFYPIP